MDKIRKWGIVGGDEMKLLDVVKPECLDIDFSAISKEEAIKKLALFLVEKYKLKDSYYLEIVEAVKVREDLSTTGVGKGVALPHCRLDSVDEIMTVWAISKDGTEFDALDGKPVNIFVLVVSPSNSDKMLPLLARTAGMMRNKPFKQELLAAESNEELFSIIEECDRN